MEGHQYQSLYLALPMQIPPRLVVGGVEAILI